MTIRSRIFTTLLVLATFLARRVCKRAAAGGGVWQQF
jgi:hypothetical protein